MAAHADSIQEQFLGIVDEDGNGFSATGKHNSRDDLSHVMKNSMLPIGEEYTVNNSQGQDACTITVSPQEGITSPKRDPGFPLLSFIKAIFPSTNDAQSYMTENCINVIVESMETMKPHDEVVGSIKQENTHMQKVLQRQASLTMCERQASFNTDKTVSERCHDAPMNRWRRYKRAASFDSRKIVIIFSILSSMGTLILIYLTLRVRQTGDSFNHV